MDSTANVKSLASIDEFVKALALTQEELVRSSEDTENELNRVTDYLQKVAPEYWKKQYQRANERWSEAREALSRCEQVTREDERRPCTEQKKQLELAKRRVEFCESRIRNIKALSQQWQQEVLKIHSHVHHVLDIGESGLPNAQNALQQIMTPLRRYAELEGGSGHSD